MTKKEFEKLRDKHEAVLAAELKLRNTKDTYLRAMGWKTNSYLGYWLWEKEINGTIMRVDFSTALDLADKELYQIDAQFCSEGAKCEK